MVSSSSAQARGILTLDVDGDRGLLPSGDGFVGGPAHDALPILHVSGGDEEGAHDALTLAVTKQGLGGGAGREGPSHLAGEAWAATGRGGLCRGGGQLGTPGRPSLHRAGVTFRSPVWLSAELQKKKKESFPSRVNISLDLLTACYKGNEAAVPRTVLISTCLPFVCGGGGGWCWVCMEL